VKIPSFVSPQLVGRHDELVLLNDRFEEARSGRTAVVALAGDTGIGKSRLVREFKASVEGEFARYAEAQCIERLSAPLFPIAEIVRALRGEETIDSELFPTGLDGQFRDNNERHLRRLAAIRSALSGEKGGKPNFVLIEDLHWADDATLALVDYVAASSRTSGPLFLVATLRTEATERRAEIARTLSRLRAAGAAVVELQPLGRTEIAALVRGAADTSYRLPREFVERIKDRSEGNPLFAEELLRAAFSTSPADLRSPGFATIRTTVLERFYEQSELDQRTLICAAVVGRFFDVRLVASLSGRTVDEIFASMRRARNAYLIRELGGPAGYVLSFRHILYSDVLYRELMTGEAADLHARVAAELETWTDRNHDSEIAFHWSAAGNAEKAVAFNFRAAEQAVSMHNYSEAARLYEEALRFTDQHSEQYAAIAEKRALAQYSSGASDQVRFALEIARRAYERLDRPAKIAEILLLQSRQAWNDVDTLDAYELAVQTASLKGLRNTRLREAATVLAALHAAHLGRTKEALRLASSVKDKTDRGTLARRNDVLALVHARLDQGEGALKRAKEATEIALGLGDPDLIVGTFSDLATILFTYGQFEEANAAWQTCHETAMRSGYSGLMAYAALGYATNLLYQGDVTRASELLRQVVDRASGGSVRMLAPAVNALLRALGDPSRLPDLFDENEGLALAIRSRENARIGHVTGLLACAKILSGESDQAEGIIDAALQNIDDPHFCELILGIGATSSSKDKAFRARTLLSTLADQPSNVLARAILHAVDRYGTKDAALDDGRLDGLPLIRAVLAYRLRAPSAARLALKRMGAQVALDRLFKTRGTSGKKKKARLTPRQLEVAQLLSNGLSNRAIAKRLGISQRTAEHHVDSVLSMLGLRSRWLISAEVLNSISA